MPGRGDPVPLVGGRTRERLAEAVPVGAARGDRNPPAFMYSLGAGN